LVGHLDGADLRPRPDGALEQSDLLNVMTTLSEPGHEVFGLLNMSERALLLRFHRERD
jgi:hypothetical protein